MFCLRLALLHDGFRAADLPRLAAVPCFDCPWAASEHSEAGPGMTDTVACSKLALAGHDASQLPSSRKKHVRWPRQMPRYAEQIANIEAGVTCKKIVETERERERVSCVPKLLSNSVRNAISGRGTHALPALRAAKTV